MLEYVEFFMLSSVRTLELKSARDLQCLSLHAVLVNEIYGCKSNYWRTVCLRGMHSACTLLNIFLLFYKLDSI